MRSIEQQRTVEIHPGFSPKPLTVAVTEAGTSPSVEPDSPSLSGILDDSVAPRADIKPHVTADMTVQDGIVSFGK
jgi:hypothetical protein